MYFFHRSSSLLSLLLTLTGTWNEWQSLPLLPEPWLWPWKHQLQKGAISLLHTEWTVRWGWNSCWPSDRFYLFLNLWKSHDIKETAVSEVFISQTLEEQGSELRQWSPSPCLDPDCLIIHISSLVSYFLCILFNTQIVPFSSISVYDISFTSILVLISKSRATPLA